MKNSKIALISIVYALTTHTAFANIVEEATHGFVLRNISEQSLSHAPINPDHIIEGKPHARSVNFAQSEDKNLAVGLWDCTAGKFHWTFHTDEIVHIIEGSVIVSHSGTDPKTLNVGDVAFFPKGLKTIWHVPKYVKKIAVHRNFDEPLHKRIIKKIINSNK